MDAETGGGGFAIVTDAASGIGDEFVDCCEHQGFEATVAEPGSASS